MGLVALLMVGCATQQERAEQREKRRQAVAEAIATRRLHIDVSMMNTLHYGTKSVSPDFFLELRGDTLCSYLPYMGQAFQPSIMTPSIGLNFEEPILRYAESRPKPNKTRLEMDVKTQEDTYHYLIDVYDTGEVYLQVRPVNRDPVSFDGSVELTAMIAGIKGSGKARLGIK